MTTQPSLFEHETHLDGPYVRPEKLARRSDPVESHIAAERVCASRIDTEIRGFILGHARGGREFRDEDMHALAVAEWTSQNIEHRWSDNSTRRVICVMLADGSLVKCGTGRTERGGPCRVWKLAGN